MRETVTIQVGQCGNQIGNQFWNILLQEHENTPDTDDAISAFFRFAPTPGSTNSNQLTMKARALLIDMECGPLTETMRGPLGSLFDETQFVMDVYGAGNNFANGHYYYGPKYRNNFEEGIRTIIEHCDSLQTFVVTHSLGGGTGSGVGTYIVGLLDELYPEIYRFSACVFPSEEDDVVTSPYNSILAASELSKHADCIFPIDNKALQLFAEIELSQAKKRAEQRRGVRGGPAGLVQDKKTEDKRGFNAMNGVAAKMLSHLTSSSRFHGDMNVDMNEICTNLIPYPRLQFLMTALSPQRVLPGDTGRARYNAGTSASSSSSSPSSNVGVTSSTAKSAIQRAFSDILSKSGQLTAADPSASHAITIASAFITRGSLRLSDFIGCVTAAQRSILKFPHWNEDACKIGMCGTPPPGEDMSVLGVYNSTAFGSVLKRYMRIHIIKDIATCH